MISGSQWFIWEILPVLEAAHAARPEDYKIAGVLLDGNKRYDSDSLSDTPTLYRSISPYWQAVDESLAPYADVPAVVSAAAQLPRDPAGPSSNLKVVGIGLALLGLAGAAYLYARGGR